MLIQLMISRIACNKILLCHLILYTISVQGFGKSLGQEASVMSTLYLYFYLTFCCNFKQVLLSFDNHAHLLCSYMYVMNYMYTVRLCQCVSSFCNKVFAACMVCMGVKYGKFCFAIELKLHLCLHYMLYIQSCYTTFNTFHVKVLK